jgi:hypothetical protein
MRRKYFLLAVCCALVSCGIAWALYLYHKPHGNVGRLSPAFRLIARDLYEEYRRDEAGANRKYTDKVIEVTGTVLERQLTDSTASIQLNTGYPEATVNCGFLVTGHAKINLPSKGSPAIIKGRCAGFLADVNLVDCVIE